MIRLFWIITCNITLTLAAQAQAQAIAMIAAVVQAVVIHHPRHRSRAIDLLRESYTGLLFLDIIWYQ